MLLLSVVCVVLSTLILIIIITGMANSREMTDLGNRTIVLAETLNHFENESDPHGLEFLSSGNLRVGNIRLTLISPVGTVLFDSVSEPDLETVGSHSDRPEFIEAQNSATRHGFSRRSSDTLGESTIYYAIRLDNENVIRLSKTTENMHFAFSGILPVMLFAVVVAFGLSIFVAIRLTTRIVKPLNEINFENELENSKFDENLNAKIEIFEELSPFIHKIRSQETKIREQYADLREKINLTETIVSNMREGILMLDKEHKIVLANSSVSKFIASDKFSVGFVGENVTKLIRDTAFRDCVKKAYSGESCNLSRTYSGRVVEVFFSPVITGGEIEGLIILFLDVTEKATAEKMRREFSANISHELKTPLTSILGTSEMLCEGMVKSDDIAKFTSVIREEASRLLRLIEDIIRISEFDEGSPHSGTLEREEFDVGILANEVVDRLRPLAKNKNVKFIAEGGGKITAIKTFIDEMLYNLIDNAIKYNAEGGEVKIAIDAGKNHTLFTVSDTGIGIPPEHLERITERFYRVDKSRSKDTGGTGLGLSIVKHIAEYHGGSVNVQSSPSQGTTITVKIQTVS